MCHVTCYYLSKTKTKIIFYIFSTFAMFFKTSIAPEPLSEWSLKIGLHCIENSSIPLLD